MKSKRPNDFMLYLDEFTFINQFGDYRKDNLMSFCHDRPYWFRNILFEYPGYEEGRSWLILDRIFPEKQKFIFLSYSNGTVPRMEFILREMGKGFNPNFFAVKDYPQFLKEYMENTKLANDRSLEIKGFIDIEGNFYRGKPLWDLLAYLKQYVDKDSSQFYYGIVRVSKPDAYPVNVTMIQALQLKGIEDETGIIRYSNPGKNIILDVIPKHIPPYYENRGIDLRTATEFQSGNVDPKHRFFIPHLNLAKITLDRFSKVPFPKEASIWE